MAQVPASELLPSQQKRNNLIEVYTFINNKHPHPKPNPHTRYYIIWWFFSAFFVGFQKKIHDPFPPFQQQPTTTQPFGSVTHLDWKLHSKVLIQFPPWEEMNGGEFAMWKKRRFPKIHPEKNRSNDIYIIYMFKGKKRCTCLFLFGKIKWLQMDLFVPISNTSRHQKHSAKHGWNKEVRL